MYMHCFAEALTVGKLVTSPFYCELLDLVPDLTLAAWTFQIMELDTSKEKADMEGLTTRVDGVRYFYLISIL